MRNLSHTATCKSEGCSAVSPVGDIPDLRGLLSFAITPQMIAEQTISGEGNSRRHWK